ncbi:hypothetical protein LINPERHAP2_LOCUS13807 [Linum perenne]
MLSTSTTAGTLKAGVEVIMSSSRNQNEQGFVDALFSWSLEDIFNQQLFQTFWKILRNKYEIQDFCFQNASLIFCTASSSYKLHSVDMKEPFLVIDEAAQMKECESTIPLQLPGIRHAVLIGDECQLPAMVRSKVADEAGFGRS